MLKLQRAQVRGIRDHVGDIWYDINGKEPCVDSMQCALDIFLAVVKPELSAVCTAFPFGGCFRSKFDVSCSCFNGCMV